MNLVQRLRLVVFVGISMAAVVFAGVNYVGIPERYLGEAYPVSVDLPESGGIFPNAEVTERGVQIGRVESIHLTPHGVRANLQIHRGVQIPRDTRVKVANLSAVGEQYVDLLPQRSGGPFLQPGAALPLEAATLPPPVNELIVRLNRLATSIGRPQLRTLVHQLGLAFRDSGPDLRSTLLRTRQLTDALSRVQPQANRLLRQGDHVLATQHRLAPQLRRLARGVDQVTAAIARSDPSIRALLRQGPRTLTDLRTLMARNGPAASVLLGNLVTVNQVLAAPTRLKGLTEELVLFPRVVQGTFGIQPGDGYARLGAVVESNSQVCTRGYRSSGTPPTEPENLSRVPGNPSLRANVNAYCAEPPSSGIDVRGAANAPRPPGDTTAHVRPQSNPRGFGPGSSFGRHGSTDRGSGHPSGSRDDPTLVPSRSGGYPDVHVVEPTDLRGLLMKEWL